jgi:hypothetical protein
VGNKLLSSNARRCFPVSRVEQGLRSATGHPLTTDGRGRRPTLFAGGTGNELPSGVSRKRDRALMTVPTPPRREASLKLAAHGAFITIAAFFRRAA